MGNSDLASSYWVPTVHQIPHEGFPFSHLPALTQQPSDVSDAPFSPLGSSPYISCSNKLICWAGKSVWLDRTDFHTSMVCGAHHLSTHCSSQTLFFVLGYILSHPSGFLYLFSECSSCMTSSPAFLISTQYCLNFVSLAAVKPFTEELEILCGIQASVDYPRGQGLRRVCKVTLT